MAVVEAVDLDETTLVMVSEEAAFLVIQLYILEDILRRLKLEHAYLFLTSIKFYKSLGPSPPFLIIYA